MVKTESIFRCINSYAFLVVLLPFLLLSIYGVKTIDGVIYFQKEYYFIIYSFFAISFILLFNKNISINIVDISVLIYGLYLLINNYNQIGSANSVLIEILLVGIYIVFKTYLYNHSDVITNIRLLLSIIFIIYAGHGFLQQFELLPQSSSLAKASGYYRNPAPYAGILISLLAFPLSYLINNKESLKGYKDWGSLIIVLIGILTVIFTKSRAALLAVVGGGMVLVVLNLNIINTIKHKYQISLKELLFIIIGILVPVLYFIISIRPLSAYGRFVIWKISLIKMFPENPFFGHGIDSFKNFYTKYQAEYFTENISTITEKFSASNTPYAFNEFLKILIEQGIIGLILFLSILLIVFVFSVKELKSSKIIENRNMLSSSLGALVSILVFASFSYPFHDVSVRVIFFLIIAISSSFIPPLFTMSTMRYFPLTLSFVIIFFGVSIFPDIERQYESYNTWRNKRNFGNIEIYNEIAEDLKHEGLFYLDYAQVLYQSKKEKAITILEESKKVSSNPSLYLKLGKYYDEGFNNIEKAEINYSQVSKTIPYKFIAKYRLLKLYIKNGVNEKAYILANDIINMPVKVKSKLVDEVKDFAKDCIEANLLIE